MNNILILSSKIIDIYCGNYTKSISSLYFVEESGMFGVDVFGKYISLTVSVQKLAFEINVCVCLLNAYKNYFPDENFGPVTKQGSNDLLGF